MKGRYWEILQFGKELAMKAIPFEIVECWGGYKLSYPSGGNNVEVTVMQNDISIYGTKGRFELTVTGEPFRVVTPAEAEEIIVALHRQHLAE